VEGYLLPLGKGLGGTGSRKLGGGKGCGEGVLLATREVMLLLAGRGLRRGYATSPGKMNFSFKMAYFGAF